MRVTQSVDIEASAENVWQVVGTGFYDVGARTTERAWLPAGTRR